MSTSKVHVVIEDNPKSAEFGQVIMAVYADRKKAEAFAQRKFLAACRVVFGDDAEDCDHSDHPTYDVESHVVRGA